MQKLPSKVKRGYWVYAESKFSNYPTHTTYGGKWLIFVSSHNVDWAWMKIRTAIENGKLGSMAKAATAKIPSKTKVICVYTYDWRDESDAKRIREELRKLGITRKIAYKADEDTELGNYHSNTNERLSKYYE